MATAAKGMEVEELREYRSATSHDASYHQNLGRVDAWLEILRATRTRRERLNRGNQGGPEAMMAAGGVPNVLTAVHGMVSADPSARPSMKRVLSHLEQGKGSASPTTNNGAPPPSTTRSVRARRRSLDLSMELARAAPFSAPKEPREGIWGELETLDGYYNPASPQAAGDSSMNIQMTKRNSEERVPRLQTFFDEAWH